jgi:hypothetical protein
MNTNILTKNLSNALDSEVKYVSFASVKFFNRHNKEVKLTGDKKEKGVVENYGKFVILLGTEKIIIAPEDMKKIIETFSYEHIYCIDIDQKMKEHFSIILRGELPQTSARSILLHTTCRESFIKSLMCYYSIYFMQKYTEIKELKVKLSNIPSEEEVAKNRRDPAFKLYEPIKFKDYLFFLKHKIESNYMNHLFTLSYISEEKETEYANKCDLTIDIDESVPLGKFDIMKDEKDISFHAYSSFIIYMRNTLKANRYWILKNSIYNRKYNLTEDIAQWEGWVIEARMYDFPVVKNIICIYLRRKFIPPYFSNFQNITIILTEDAISKEKYKINPKAYELTDLIASSIHYSIPVNNKEYMPLLRAKVNSLLLDEEAFYYFENTLGIIGSDVHRIGYEFLYWIILFLESNIKAEKEYLDQLKKAIDSKIKLYMDMNPYFDFN